MAKMKSLFNWKTNPIIGSLLVANILSNTGWAFISPILAIYVVRNITGGTVQVVGMCYFIYWIIKGVLQLFIAKSLDKVKGEGDDYFALLLGQLLDTMVPIALIFAHSATELYLIFFIYGIGDALYIPPWNALFTRHVNPEQVSSQWALDSSGFNLGAAVAIVTGSALAVAFGFRTVFVLVAIAQLISLYIVLRLGNHFKGRQKVLTRYFFPLEK